MSQKKSRPIRPARPAESPPVAFAAISAPEAPPPATPPPDDALFYEAKVADSLGIARARVRSVRRRHLTAPDDYTVRSGFVVLTPGGLDRLIACLGQREKIADEPAPVVPAGPPARATLTIVRVPPNRRILICRSPAPGAPAGATTTALVRDNSLFMPGMAVPCIALPHGGWQFTGRLPRRRGKW